MKKVPSFQGPWIPQLCPEGFERWWNRQRREKTSTKGVMVEGGGTKRRWKTLGRLDTVIIQFCFEKVKNLGWKVMEICETCSSALTSRDSGKEWMWPNGGLWDLKKRMGWHPVWADFCCERKGVNIYTEMYGFFGEKTNQIHGENPSQDKTMDVITNCRAGATIHYLSLSYDIDECWKFSWLRFFWDVGADWERRFDISVEWWGIR